MTAPHRSPLAVNIKDIPDTVLVSKDHLTGGSIGAKIAYGKTCSMIHATRNPGYHSKPHTHDAEQLNYVLSGKVRVFIGDEVVDAVEGDVVRIPSNVIHWSWVQGDTPCSVIEMHTPSLIGDPGVLDTAVALIGEDEEPGDLTYVHSEYLLDFDPAPFEARVPGE